jgi:hypothetical protein
MKEIKNGNSIIQIDDFMGKTFFNMENLDYKNANTIALCIREAYDYFLEQEIENVYQTVGEDDYETILKSNGFVKEAQIDQNTVIVKVPVNDFVLSVSKSIGLI